MEKEHSDEFVKFILTEAEKRDLATDMARKVAELNQAEDEKKAIMSDLKSKIDGLAAAVNSAATKLNNGYEYRTVSCEIDRDYKAKLVRYWFDEQIVKEKLMAQNELQKGLFDMEND